MENPSIKCSVNNCKHNKSGSSCSLSDITVGNTTMEACASCDTECVSFKAR